MVTVHFPLWVEKRLPFHLFTLGLALAFFLSFALALALGPLADRVGLRKPFFSLFSLLVVFLCASLAFTTSSLWMSLLLFYLLAVCHQQALAFYNTLLLDFEEMGWAAGVGVGVGYLGSALSLLFFRHWLAPPEVYLWSAGIFLCLALPALWLLPNPPQRKKEMRLAAVLGDHSFLWWMASVFCLTEVANAATLVMAVYLRHVYGFSGEEAMRVIGLCAFFGVAGGFFWGWLGKSLGTRRLLAFGFFYWTALLLALPMVPQGAVLFLGAGMALGLALVGATVRVELLENFPKEESSTRMSFLSLTERLASSGGLVFWSFLLWATGENYRLSGGALAVFPLLGIFLFQKWQKLDKKWGT